MQQRTRTKVLLTTGVLVLAMLTIPWVGLPYGDLDWVALGQPYEPTMTPVATSTATVTVTPVTPETYLEYLPLIRKDLSTPTPTPGQ